jgi:hypothetical protein
LEVADYIEDVGAVAGATDATIQQEELDALEPALANALVVSLHAFAGIRTENTMLLPVTVKGEQLVALLDTGSTHNFLPGATMQRLGFAPTGGEQLRITVTNGDRLRCEGIVHNVPITIGGEEFAVTCVGLDLGCFDFILGVDFLRTLGPILWDFATMMMAFWRGDRRVRWQGVGGSALATHQLQLAAASTVSQQPLLERLLQQHIAIFEEPQG